MNRTQALQTAARRFCKREYALWNEKYVNLQRTGSWQVKGSSPSTWDYSDEAYSLFPRYRFAEKALIEIESVTLLHEDLLGQDREVLQQAGRRAHDVLAKEFTNTTALKALRTAATVFAEFLDSVPLDVLDQVEPLPHRRVLSASESETLWAVLKDKWKIRGAGYGWFPLSDDVPPNGALTFHEDLWRSRDGDGVLQSFLLTNGIQNSFLLRELGPPDYEIETSLVGGVYDGSESFLMTLEGDWVLYVSHESSLALTGLLADFFRSKWTDSGQLAYGGPFHTPDLRGTWG